MLFMGLDVGTQGIRCIVVDDQGEVIAGNSIAFGKINTAKEPDHYRQSADDWWDAAAKTISACISDIKSRNYKVEEIASISIDGTSGTIVPLDSEHKPLCDAFMYNDMRARDETIMVRKICESLEIKMGLRFNASFSLPRILWIKNNMPEIYEKTDVFAHQADYIAGMLSGEYHVSDYSNALKTGYDLIDGCWPQCITTGLEIEAGKLPKIVGPGTAVGRVTRNAAAALGLSEQIIVVAGSTDGYASALAAGAVDVGNWVSTIGTTMVLKGVTKSLIIDPSGSSYSHKLPSGNWMLGGAANIGGRCLNSYFDKEEFSKYEVYSFLQKDSLANLYNRRYMNQMLPAEIERSNEDNNYLTIAMVDIDHFKNVNDTYGHYTGDIVIKTIGEIMTKYIRKDTDWIARYGGDEFFICLHDVDQTEARKIVERLRKAVESTVVKVEDKSVKVTASFGLITVKNTKLKSDDLIKMADDKLYEAKRQGRNRVVS